MAYDPSYDMAPSIINIDSYSHHPNILSPFTSATLHFKFPTYTFVVLIVLRRNHKQITATEYLSYYGLILLQEMGICCSSYFQHLL